MCGIAPKKHSENILNEGETGEDDNTEDKGIIKLTKAERRAKLKKSKKDAKKQGKEVAKTEVEQTPQAAVLVLLFSRWLNYFY